MTSRQAALDALRKRKSKPIHSNGDSEASTSSTSRFFVSKTSVQPEGRILAPDSSPSASSAVYKPQPQFLRSSFDDEALSVPSGFTSRASSSSSINLIPLSSPRDDESRPRKRPNQGPANPSIHHPSRISQTRRQLSAFSLNSDHLVDQGSDDLPDVDELLKPRRRLVRGVTHQHEPPNDVADSSPALNASSHSFGSPKLSSKGTVLPARGTPDSDIQPKPSPLSPIVSLSNLKGNRKSAIYAKRGLVSGQRNESVPSISNHKNRKRKRPRSGSESSTVPSETSDDSEHDAKSLRSQKEEALANQRQTEVVSCFNNASEEELIELTSCTASQASIIISLRPFDEHAQLREKLTKRKGVSYKLFETAVSVLSGYGSLDALLQKCEDMGRDIDQILSKWNALHSTEDNLALSHEPSLLGLEPAQTSPPNAASGDDPDLQNYLHRQPPLLAKEVQLKDYQLLGVNWLNLLWSKRMSCILADEMGLGKTVQVIAFLSHLKSLPEHANDHHLIIVPASTLENWVREFERFAPEINVQTYYGSQTERTGLRHELKENSGWDVLVTTYNLAQGSDLDRKFFRKVVWEVCVFDEGHVLKNFQSQRYTHLMNIPAKWRLLLTGTPLQNNLQELVSLLSFIMPNLFYRHDATLRAIFNAKADSHISFLSRERISRAQRMMNPFVLRRRKDQVLKELPKKTERIEWCAMTTLQDSIYKEALQRSRKTLQSVENHLVEPSEATRKPKPKRKSRIGATLGESSNVLMDLRKASSHPMLFRRQFDIDKIRLMAKQCMRETEFCDSNYEYIVEDMEVMTDAELQKFCNRYKSVRHHALSDSCFFEAGKIEVLGKLLKAYVPQQKRILIFSQFTQVLDILEVVLARSEYQYLLLTGSTPVDERQSLVDEFNDNEDIPVFLLSTRAGGMGINLTAACIVIIFDQDFNPHNDRQACDRAYRIGQKQDVEIIKLITRGTIEEDILRLGETKLLLDSAVAAQEQEENAPENEVKASLLSLLRKKLEEEDSAMLQE